MEGKEKYFKVVFSVTSVVVALLLLLCEMQRSKQFMDKQTFIFTLEKLNNVASEDDTNNVRNCEIWKEAYSQC